MAPAAQDGWVGSRREGGNGEAGQEGILPGLELSITSSSGKRDHAATVGSTDFFSLRRAVTNPARPKMPQMASVAGSGMIATA